VQILNIRELNYNNQPLDLLLLFQLNKMFQQENVFEDDERSYEKMRRQL